MATRNINVVDESSRQRGRRIREMRRKLHMKQRELAEKTGVTITTEQRWESGVITPKIGKFEQIASLLGTTPEYLAGWVTEEEAAALAEMRSGEGNAVENRLVRRLAAYIEEIAEKAVDDELQEHKG